MSILDTWCINQDTGSTATSFGFKIDHPRYELVENILYIFLLDTECINQCMKIVATAFGVEAGHSRYALVDEFL